VNVKAAIWIGGVLGAGVSCFGRPGAARIAYINADRRLAAVVEQAAREQGAPAVAAVVIPAAGAEVRVGSGEAREVAYAEAAIAIPGLVAVVGHPSSRASLLAAPIYGEAGVPFIVPTATSRRLRDAGPWTFQLAPDDEAEGAFIAAFALDSLAARDITIFYLVADEYGIGLRDGIVNALRSRGVVPADEVGILEDSDFPRRVAASLRRRTPRAVVIAARTAEAAAIARAVRGRLPSVPLLLADGVGYDAAALGAGSRGGAVYAVAWWRPEASDSASRAFVARFERAAGRAPRPQEAMYYDGLMLAAEAVRVAGPRRVAIQRFLRELGGARPPYQGITGPISFTPGRRANLVMVRVGTGAVAATLAR
jgi:branched-chain amino acid transport system substrate-binding protein